MFPGCFYLLACWYKRSEAQKRYSFFFSSTTLAGAFGGLLAAAIGKMDGVGGYKAWRWVFILEGLFTCVVGIVFYWCIPDFPEETKWLNENERAFIKAKLEADTGENHRHGKTSLKGVFKILGDWKIQLGGLMYFGLIVPAYGYAYFSPQIVRNLGYSPIETQLRSVPPWACAFALAMLTATCSDWLRHRYLFTLIPMCISLAGFVTLFQINGPRQIMTQYASLFLCAMGTYSAMPIIICWYACNLGSHARRAVGTGWQVGFGNVSANLLYFYLNTYILTQHPIDWRHHRYLCLPRQRSSSLPNRLQALHFLHLLVRRCMPCILPRHLLGKPKARQGPAPIVQPHQGRAIRHGARRQPPSLQIHDMSQRQLLNKAKVSYILHTTPTC